MKTDMRTRSKSITAAVVLVLLMAGAALTLYVFKESEPVKVFMICTVIFRRGAHRSANSLLPQNGFGENPP